MSKKNFRSFLARWIFTPLAGVTFGNWLFFLQNWGSQISPRYWPRTLFTTCMAILNSFVKRIESARYESEISNAHVKNPLFIIGHHRSGTTHLWNLLSQDQRFVYPNVLQTVFPETFLTFENWIKGLARVFAPRKRPQDNVPIDPESPIEEERAICASTFLSIQMARHLPQLRDHFKKYLTMREVRNEESEHWKTALDRFARKLSIKYGEESILLFKAPPNTARIRLLLDLYPDARFIHIHRDPYRVYQSTMKMEKTTISLYTYQNPDLDELEEFVLWRYQAMNDALFKDLSLIPEGQFVEVAFDDLDREPVLTVKRIYDALALQGFDEMESDLEAYVKSISDYKKNTYPELPEETKKRIQSRWGISFETFGYPVN